MDCLTIIGLVFIGISIYTAGLILLVMRSIKKAENKYDADKS